MRKEYWGLALCLGALFACKKMAKEMIRGEQGEVPKTAAPTTAAAAATPAATPPATAPQPVATAAAAPVPGASAEAVASAAAASAFDGKYALDGIRQIPLNCKFPSVILTAVTQQAFDSKDFEWNFAKQVYVANPQFKPSFEQLEPGANKVLFRAHEHKPTKGMALVASCNSAETCMQVAAVYKIVVPTSRPEVMCGGTENLLGMGTDSIVVRGFPPEDLPKKENVVQQCVRLAACQARRDGKLEGDPAIDCQKKPSKFALRCSFKETCDGVMSCVEKAANDAAAAK